MYEINPTNGTYLLPLQLSFMPVQVGSANSRIRARADHQRAMMRATARAVLAERGYAGVHMRDLANLCGVSVQTIYNNLGGREEILCAATDELLRIQIARTHAESLRTGRNFMLVFCELTTRLMEQDKNYVNAILAILKNRNCRSVLAYKFEQRCIEAFRRQLWEMRQAGSLKVWVDIDMLATMLQDTMRDVLTARLSSGADDAEGIRDQMIRNVGLLLLGACCGSHAARIETTLEGLFSKRA